MWASLVNAIRAAYVRSGLRETLPMSGRFALRRARVRLARKARQPVASVKLHGASVPKPRRPLRLARVLVACDLNARYLESWELVARAWPAVAGVEPLLVLVADEASAPPQLLADERVHLFEPLPSLHTAFQAQCIRLLYPALVESDGAILISDMELVPLDPRYFRDPPELLDERLFVAYRDLELERRQVVMPYNAARPEVWADVFGIETIDDVRARLEGWGTELEYDAVRGGHGWYTDQEMLYATLMPWHERTGRLWIFDDEYTGFRRLDRPDVADGLTNQVRVAIRSRRYTDFNSLVPHGDARAVNDEVLELALEALQR